MNRRNFIKSITAGALGFSFLSKFGTLGAVDDILSHSKKLYPQAKSVIEIWMWGGPSQLETFDPKPDADAIYNNGLKSIPTNVSGIEISQWLPKLAQQADKYSIIRTMTHPYNGHETASYIMQTGRSPGGGRVFPAIGVIVSMFKRKNYNSDIPPYIILTKAKGRFSEVGFLGDKYAPLVTGGNPNNTFFSVDGITAPGKLKKEIENAKHEALNAFDTFGNIAYEQGLESAKEFRDAGDKAKDIIFGDTAKVFDLTQESAEMRDFYGRSDFGQSCLVARRLVERNVPYITINAEGWDSHKKHFDTMPKRTAAMDQGVAALLEDLSKKGLLDSTIVLWTGEFGRTPKIGWEAPWFGGRNHYAKCFSAMVAGGGFEGGKVVGVSDKTASNVVSRPVAPQDLIGSIYELCGIDPDGDLPNDIGLKTSILPPQSKAGRLYEIYKKREC